MDPLTVNNMTYTNLTIKNFLEGGKFSVIMSLVKNSIPAPLPTTLHEYAIPTPYYAEYPNCSDLKLSKMTDAKTLACISFNPFNSSDEDSAENVFLDAMGKIYFDEVRGRMLYSGPLGEGYYWVWEIKKKK